MGLLFIAFIILIILLLFKPFIDELPTVYQILKSFFAPKINLKTKYGPWAIVTGCTDGIGKSLSFELAKRGLNIVLISRNLLKLEKVAHEIESTTRVKTKIIVADFSKGREIYENIKEEIKDLDIGILYNNVGIAYSRPMYYEELPEDEIWSLINVNVGAATEMTRIILPDMVSKKKGAIVNVSSGSQLLPIGFEALYPASKIFLNYFTEGLREEYKNSGITFQLLCPYYVSTKINDYFEPIEKGNNILIPDPDTYAYHAINTLGVIDNTTGYWAHRLMYVCIILLPMWLRIYGGGNLYKYFSYTSMKKGTKEIS